jgi:hypothetical protein
MPPVTKLACVEKSIAKNQAQTNRARDIRLTPQVFLQIKGYMFLTIGVILFFYMRITSENSTEPSDEMI